MARIMCGCGVGMNNPEQAAEHAKDCSQPQIDIGEMERNLDTSMDFCYAIGYVRVDKQGMRRMMSAAR